MKSTKQDPSSPINQRKSERQENKKKEIGSLEKNRKEEDASNEIEKVEEERYSTPYVVKTGLRAIVMNNKEVIAVIERKSKELTRASIRISFSESVSS
jgi:hypothetical protein